MATRLSRLIWAAVAVIALTAGAEAKVFRWANDGDSNSMDPYARQETFLLSFDSNIYEPLVQHDDHLQPDPAPATADDVVFSYQRVTGPGSSLAATVALVKEVKKIDDYTVDIVTKGPDPILPGEI